MTLDFSKLPEIWQWILAVAAIVSALLVLGGAVRIGWKALTALTKLVAAAPALMDLPQFMKTTAYTLAEQDTKIEEIHHEVQFNNGSSVKDAVTRVEAAVTVLSDTVGANTTKLTSSLANQRRIERGVKGLYTRVDANEKAATEDRANIAATQKELEDTRPRNQKE